MSAFDTMLANVFASAIGCDMTYTPNGQSALPTFRACSKTPDVESEIGKPNKLRQQSSIFEVLVADLAAAAPGDAFTVNIVNYRVMTAYHKDQDRLIWLIEGAPT